MGYDNGLAERLREIYDESGGATEKKMFGGIAFMVDGHMSTGINEETLMVRVGPDRYLELLARPHAREMDFTGKPLRGFLYIAPEGFIEDEDLRFWVDASLDFVRSLPPK